MSVERAASDRPPAAAPADGGRCRVRVRIEGTVQGVGFRPHVDREVRARGGLGGFVRNDERGVLLELEGAPDAVRDLLDRLAASPPPLASIERVTEEPVPVRGETAFAIVASEARGEATALVTPDAATCDACLAELFDPADRRHRYPFINCTGCGPRFTIARAVPYDRSRTTMAAFAMCAACRAEYEDPRDRRFHAEPIACAACGPTVRLVRPGAARGEVAARGEAAIEGAARALRRGEIVAVKGLGGFHLACRADGEDAVAALRSRKRREDRPFAVMVETLEDARRLAVVPAEDAALLASRERPIVLVRRRPRASVARSVAPGRRELGLLLPYTPLHHLLLRDVGAPLVMTSGNVSDEPIAFEDDDALERLASVADAFVLHDRPIQTRTDDGVARTVRIGADRRRLTIRRSRGAVPAPLRLPVAATRPILAVGGHLKSVFCLARGERAWTSHHIGDLETWRTRRAFAEGIEHAGRLLGVRPEVVAHDLHPDYASTAHALAMEGVERVAVQHHHAHLAAVLAEHGETARAIGVIFDGAGAGPDGTVWGGELLVGDLAGFERAGHLRAVRLPGGERAVRQPWRMACAWMLAALGPEAPRPPTLRRIDAERWRAVERLAATGPAAPVTTSVGRLFDAVAALAGVRSEVTHEGQAAIELEARAAPREAGAYEVEIIEEGDRLVIDPRPAILDVLRDVCSCVDASRIAARFHRGLAAGTVAACARLGRRRGIETVVLSGGVFQNRLLLETVAELLIAGGLRPLVPIQVPPNDGGIAFGQAAVAAALTGGR